ncbi:hypothetical protein STIAU_0530 [Stigmatella aurantiaca DW4/3-1]|uniref:Uncharacterized protein n=1 Tax=Stigmatella aurantiaca (strain DW4/3-1) TaxID=378806 RepID=Q094I2_STIAD|nr:hypothetical protein STIAU_0530 [Stigmatella aurantiaca DW4/3-1]
MPGELLHHLGLLGPLLEQHGGGLHEVPLRLDAADAAPPLVAREDGVQQVPELVEERLDFIVRHQLAGAREVAHQHALREALAGLARHQIELRRVLVLVIPRVHVEVDAAQGLAALHHVISLHLGVPYRGVLHGLKGDAPEVGGDAHHPLFHARILEVGAHRLGVEPEALRPQPVLVVVLLPRLHGGGALHILLLPLQQLRHLPLGPGPRHALELLDEAGRHLGRARHPGLGVVGRPARIAQERRQLVPLGDELRQDGLVLGEGALPVGAPQLLARLGVLRVRHQREVVRVVGRDDHLAVLARRVRPEIVLRQPLQLLGRERDGAHVLGDVLAELLAELEDLLVERLHLGPGGVVPVHARAAEVEQRALHPVARGVIRPREVHRGQGVINPSILGDLHVGGVHQLLARAGRIPHGRVRVHFAGEAGAAGGVEERGHGLVIRGEHGGPLGLHVERLQRGHLGVRPLDAGGARGGEGGGSAREQLRAVRGGQGLLHRLGRLGRGLGGRGRGLGRAVGGAARHGQGGREGESGESQECPPGGLRNAGPSCHIPARLACLAEGPPSREVVEDPLDVLVLLERVHHLEDVGGLVLGQLDGVQGDVLGLGGDELEAALLDGRLELPEVIEGTADDDLLLALLASALAHLLESMVDELQLDGVEVQPLGGQPEDAHSLEEVGDAAGGSQVAAAVLEVHADVGHGAHDVVGRGLDEHRDAVGPIAFVEDDFVVLRVLAAGTLDGGLDLVLRHVADTGVLQGAAEGGVVVRAGSSSLDGDDDVLADPREQLRHLVPAGEHRGLACLEDSSHDRCGEGCGSEEWSGLRAFRKHHGEPIRPMSKDG